MASEQLLHCCVVRCKAGIWLMSFGLVGLRYKVDSRMVFQSDILVKIRYTSFRLYGEAVCVVWQAT